MFRRILNKIFIAILFIAGLLFFLYLPTTIRFLMEEKSISVYMFTEFISPTAIRDFEKETGVKVYVQYYESNEELCAKFKINEGVGYDLITPSDYMVEILKKNELLQKIHSEKLSHFCKLDSRVLHRYFDEHNEYSIPLTWSVYGIVFDRFLFKKSDVNVGFDFIFKNPEDLFRMGLITKPYKVCMFDDPREVFLLAALYLFGKVKGLNEKDWAAVESLLIDQKQWVECYTNFGLRYFLEGNIVSFAVMSSRYLSHILETNNVRFGFSVPKNGSLLVIENFAIPVHSKKTLWVHKFIDFMISRKYSTYHFDKYGGNPVNTGSYRDINQKYFGKLQFFPSDELFDKLYLIHNELPLRKLEEMWLRVKTA
jgi:spermidine/putrescine transport system substrate-binding protein